MSGGECADANTVDICVDSLLGDLEGRLFTRVEKTKEKKNNTLFRGERVTCDLSKLNVLCIFIKQTLHDFTIHHHLIRIIMNTLIKNLDLSPCE